MWDRFLVLLDDGRKVYTISFEFLCSDKCIDVLKHERTFDGGQTYIEI